jgi:MFS family permease
VFNLIAISVAWSVLVDVFAVAQAKRLFGLMAAGASLGGLTGPLLGVLLVEPIGHAGLLLLAAILLIAAAFAAHAVQRWGDDHPVPGDRDALRERPLGGSPFAGATEVLRSPYLLGIAVFVLLLARRSTWPGRISSNTIGRSTWRAWASLKPIPTVTPSHTGSFMVSKMLPPCIEARCATSAGAVPLTTSSSWACLMKRHAM